MMPPGVMPGAGRGAGGRDSRRWRHGDLAAEIGRQVDAEQGNTQREGVTLGVT